MRAVPQSSLRMIRRCIGCRDSRLGGCRPATDPLEPGSELVEAFRDRLSGLAELIDVAVQADVGDCESVPGEPVSSDEPIDPTHAVACTLLHSFGSFGKAAYSGFEKLQPLRIVKAVHHRVANL